MKNDKIIPGLILVLIGAAILLANYGYLHFHWWNIFRLWPIFLVIAGVNLVFAHQKSPWATVIKVSVVVIGLGLLFFGNFGERYNFWPGNHFNWSTNDNDDNDDDDDSSKSDVKVVGNGTFNEPYKADIKVARLNLNGGGTTYNLSDTTNQLFSATTKDGDSNRYNFTHSMDDSVYVLDFKMKNNHGFNWDSDKNRAAFRLNPKPEWEIDVETGATALDFDLSKFKIRELKLHGGAASFKIKFGMPLAMTDVDVSTGVSEVDISIPKDAACSIETDSGLSGNEFSGFTDVGDNRHETPGYATAKNKMHIHISGGLSDFKVNRY
jgi:cell wall-active antibiotic response 4TMS protein YvqF